MKRRIFGIITLLVFGVFLLPFPASAEKNEETTNGDWIRVDVQDYYVEREYDDDDYGDDDPNDYEYSGYSAYTGNHSYYFRKYKCIPDTDESKSTDIDITWRCEYTVDDMIFFPEIAAGGEKLTVDLSFNASIYNEFEIEETYSMAFASCDPDEPMRAISKKDKVLLSMTSLDEEEPEPVQASVTFPKSAKNGDRFAISFRSNYCETRWIYEWKADEVDKDISELGEWKLVDVDVHVPDTYNREYNITYLEGPDDEYKKVVTYKGTETSHSFGVDENNIIAAGTVNQHYDGSWTIKLSGAPPAVLTPGEIFDLGLSSTHEHTSSDHVTASLENTNLSAWYSYRGDLEIKALLDFEFRGAHSVNEESPDETAKIAAPIPDNPKEELYCGFRFISYIFIKGTDLPDAIFTDWIYEWVPKSGAAVADVTDENGENVTAPEPAHAEVIKDADKEAGEDKEGIPAGVIAAILGGLAVVGGGGGVAVAKASKKKKGKDDKNDDKKDDKKNDSSKSTFEMRINKNFGDIIPVDEEVCVYARIVEITENGAEKPREDLTQRITISSPEYLKVANEQMSGGYKAATVLASSGKRDEVPQTAMVSFCLASAAGSFTEKIIFRISNPCITFGQENLTLPAGHEKTEELTFIIYGMKVSETKIQVKGNDYEVELKEEEPRPDAYVYKLLVKEKTKEPLEVGETSQNVVKITAKHTDEEGRERKLEEDFCIYRMGMGILLDVADIGCYLTKDNTPVVTKAHVMLITWDEENNQIIRAEPNMKTFRAVHWYKDSGNEMSDSAERESRIIDALAVGLTVPKEAKVDSQKGVECEIQCKGAILDKPQMLRCDIEMTAEYKEKTYSTKKEYVLLTSRRRRVFKTAEEEKTAVRKDKQIKESLGRILDAINSYGMEAQYHSMAVLIKLMLDSYQFRYGFDDELVKKIQKVYTNILNGMKAMDDLECSQMDELEKSFFGKCAIVADYAKQCEDSMSLGKRMALGICTLGASEGAFLTCQVYREMREAAINSKGDGAFDIWCSSLVAGVKVVAVEALIDYASGKAMTYGKRQLAKLKAGKPDINAANKAAKAMNGNPDKTIASKLNTVEAARLSSAGEQSMKAAKEASEAVEKAVQGAKKLPLSEADEAFERGVELGRKKLEMLAAAQGDEFVEQAMSVQMDKYSMTALKRMKGDAATELRAKFNKVIMKKNDDAVRMTKEALAKEFGCSADQIKTFKASSNTAKKLKAGTTTTFDLDVTYQFIDKNGVIHDVNQNVAARLHNEACYKSWHGVKPPSQDAAKQFAIGVDHSVVQKGSLENYGSVDVLEKIIDKTRQGEVMTSKEAARAGETITEKGMERLRRCEEWLKKAVTGDTPQVREAAFKAASMEKAEGFRQIVKQADYLMSKDIIGMSRGSATCISPKMRFAWETMRKVGEGTLPPDVAEKLIMETCGMDSAAICKETGKLLGNINNSLAGTAGQSSLLKSVFGWIKSDNHDLI